MVLYTDHSAIKYLANKPITNGRVTEWLIRLQEFDITIKDRPGKENLLQNSSHMCQEQMMQWW